MAGKARGPVDAGRGQWTRDQWTQDGASGRRQGASGRETAPEPTRLPGNYSPEYACRPLNHSEPEYVTSTIRNPTTSSIAAGRPAHERWLRAWR